MHKDLYSDSQHMYLQMQLHVSTTPILDTGDNPEASIARKKSLIDEFHIQ